MNMNAILQVENNLPRVVLEQLMARHGVWRVLVIAARAAMARQPTARAGVEQLSDHLRRDIGLPERGIGWQSELDEVRRGW